MADSATVEKQENLDDNSSSEEWTIIYKREAKITDLADETSNTELNDPKETIVTEDACQLEEINKLDAEQVEQGEEADEKEGTTSDVPDVFEESEPELLTLEDGRVERIGWQVEERSQSMETRTLTVKTQEDGLITTHALITCSVIALIGMLITGQMLEFVRDKPNLVNNEIIEDKLKELSGIEEKLKELNDVKQALEQIRISMPEMKILQDQLTNQKSENNELLYTMKDYQNLKNLNILNNFNSDNFDHRLELLGDTYQILCSTINKFHSFTPMNEKKLCETPKILSDMILFKKNLKRAIEETKEFNNLEKREFIEMEKRLQSETELLISKLPYKLLKITQNIEKRLSKYRLNDTIKKLCLLHNNGQNSDKLINTILNTEFVKNRCNKTLVLKPIISDSNLNSSAKLENHRINKRPAEIKKDSSKYDYKNVKEYKKRENSKDNNLFVKDQKEEYNSAKSKGEIKNDSNWKKNKYESEEKFVSEEKINNKNEKNDINYKNDYKKNINENIVNKSSEHSKKEREYNPKYENNKKEHYYEYNAERKKDHAHDYNHKYDYKIKDSQNYRKYEDNRNYDYDSNNMKFTINENVNDKYDRSSEEKERYINDKNYDHSKESKYTKYQKSEQRKKDRYQSDGEWQMQRGKAREKLRNSDWYFVRADSRQRARVYEEEPPPHKKERGESHFRKEDNLRRRVLRKVGRTWDFLNSKILNYF